MAGLIRLFLLAGLLVAAQAFAATSMNFHLEDRLAKLLDASAPAAERELVLDQYRKDALAGDIAAQYFIGNLYRLGNKLPGNIVARDPDQAFRYLSNAGAHGFIIAMAKTAELELELKKPYEAMLWTQLYGHYEGYGDAKVDAANHRPRTGGYYANLLHRTYAVFGSDATQTQAMQADFQAFIEQHDAEIHAGMVLGRDARAAPEQKPRPAPQKINFSSLKAGLPAHAQDDLGEFVVAFSADGKVKRVFLFDCTPDIAMGPELSSAMLRIQAEATTDQDGLRYAWVSLNMQGYGTERILNGY
ncbi:MAG TPA: hypothetical protein VIE67_01950 [Rudaea sp.]|jgi:hypothetical protein|uniref:hypothetical protein n=1 Tax=Rudaea sp. TaxID=2136325 RepID=UPI002F95722E